MNSTLETSQTAASSNAGDQKAEGIAPVFIKHILQSQEGNFQFFDLAFGVVTCVAIVRSIDISSTKITYILEDHTGRINAHYWLEEEETLNVPNVMINNYAKLFGSMKSQEGQKVLMVFKILPVMNPNELNTHILETLNARYKAEEFSTTSIVNPLANERKNGELEHNSFTAGFLGLEGKQLAVLQAIKSNITTEGISRKDLKRKFVHLDEKEINGIVEFLISEGHIYSSFDADHFVSSE